MDHLTPVKTALLVQRQALSACRVKVRRSLSIYPVPPSPPRLSSSLSPALGPPPSLRPSLSSISSPLLPIRLLLRLPPPLSVAIIRSSYRCLAPALQADPVISVCLQSSPSFLILDFNLWLGLAGCECEGECEGGIPYEHIGFSQQHF